MTSEQDHALFRMPDRLFAELATGGGSAGALAFLERGERARRLLLLRTLLGHLDALPTPLTPAAEAWRVLKEAAEKAPEPVERLLLAPTTGGWISHMLRRVHGTATGPALWAEAGHLCALALSAALYAGTEASLDVSLTSGRLPLPGLGMVQLPDAKEGLTVGRAVVAGGEVSVTGPANTGGKVRATCRPGAAAPDSGVWLPLRTLTHQGTHGTAPVMVVLEDLDPFRDLDDHLPPTRLDEDEAREWQWLFSEAVRILASPGTPGPGRVDPAAIRAIVPFGRTTASPPPPSFVQVSASSGDSFGGMLIARPSSPLALAETLVHELQHSKLAALLHLFPLLEDEDDRTERYYAPWRADPRHLTGLLHGAYAFTGVAGFWRDRLADAQTVDAQNAGVQNADTRSAEAAERAGYFFALRRLQSRLAVRTLLTSGRLTVEGRALVSGLARTLDGWLREDVPPAALARARTAAALHRTEWRLRNVVPAPAAAPSDLRFRRDRTVWPDVRTHAFATPAAVPRTADEHLAAGDAAAALTRYADVLADAPAEPQALAGWVVARTILEPGRAARRMLARPEELLEPSPRV
ncbi:HEXXH motif domain-containing protein [Streptomyces massasporeus]